MSLLRLRQTRENSFSPACVPHPPPTVSSTMSSACPLLYCSCSRVAPWESLLLPMRQALPVRVWKPRVGLPLSIDVLLRPRGRKFGTLHRCHTLPAAAWRRRTGLLLLPPPPSHPPPPLPPPRACLSHTRFASLGRSPRSSLALGAVCTHYPFYRWHKCWPSQNRLFVVNSEKVP